jgi:hypothetical protein
MNTTKRYAPLLGIAGLFALCAAFAPVRAQEKSAPPSPEAKAAPAARPLPVPRTRDGHPDLSGIWAPGVNEYYDLAHPEKSSRFDRKATPQDPAPFQRWAVAKQKLMGPIDDAEPDLTCTPLGVPGFMNKGGYPIQNIQTPKQLVVLNELDTTYRIIWTDGRPHQQNPDPQYNGDAVGHWEGDTLVVDVIGLDWHTWVNLQGWFISDVIHLVERHSRPDYKTYLYQVTIEDPKVLTRPWTSVPWRYTLTELPLVEWYCTNNHDYEIQNPTGPKYISSSGLDERYFDEQEYQKLKQQYPEPSPASN